MNIKQFAVAWVAIIGLIVFGLMHGPVNAQVPETPEEIAKEIEKNVLIGLDLELAIFAMYLADPYNLGAEATERNVEIATKFAVCSLLWAEISNKGWVTENITADMYDVSSWRSVQMARLYIGKIGGEPDRIDNYLLPMLRSQTIGFTPSSIVQCAAFDNAAVYQLGVLELPTSPPSDWEREEAPETSKEPTFDS